MAFAAPEAGGEIVVLALRAMAFASLLGYLIARGLIAGWTNSFGLMLEWLASELDLSIPTGFGHIKVDIGAPFAAVDHVVVAGLESWAEGLEAEVAYFMDSQATVEDWVNGQIQGLARDAADSFDWLVHSFIPTFAHGVAHDILPVGHLLRLIDHEIERLVHDAGQVIHVVEHDVTHIVTKVVQAAGAIPLPNPWAFPAFHRWWHDLTRWREVTQHRLARLEKLLGAAGMAAVMANVLGLPNWRCLTRGNIGKVSRALCGLSAAAIEDVLGLIVDLLILEDICSVTKLIVKGFGLIEGPLTAFVTAAETWACYGDKEKPRTLDIPQLYLPAVTGIVLYLP